LVEREAEVAEMDELAEVRGGVDDISVKLSLRGEEVSEGNVRGFECGDAGGIGRKPVGNFGDAGGRGGKAEVSDVCVVDEID
jgi:hypothetical protein